MISALDGRQNRIFFYVSVVAFLVVLFFGLDPKGYDFSNHVFWLSDRPGLIFDKYGVVCAQLDVRLLKRIRKQDGFSILMAFQSGQPGNTGSGHILTLYAGSDRNQLVIWQWSSYIIAMNDDDFTHRRNIGRVSTRIPSAAAQEVYLSLTTGKKGTILYFNGRAVSSSQALVLSFPIGTPTTLILGNSVYGDNPWKGTITGLALFDRQLTPESVESLYASWIRTQSFVDAEKKDPILLYLFNEKSGSLVLDQTGSSTSLHIPSRATPLRRKFLAGSFGDLELTDSLTWDVFINLSGFIPLGFFVTTLLTKSVRISWGKAIAYAVFFCFVTSLSIEIIQAWIPSRYSQSMDLLLNTAGAFLGALLSATRISNLYFKPSS